jgi:hypothetical protein
MIRQFCIPELEDIVVIAKYWVTTVQEESRNWHFLKAMGLNPPESERYPSIFLASHRPPAKIHHLGFEPGTRLKVDRIYIRKGAEGFSSVTFKTRGAHVRISGTRDIHTVSGRFWVPLVNANGVQFTWPEPE